MGHKVEREIEGADGTDNAEREVSDQAPSLLGLSAQVERDDLSSDSFRLFRGNVEGVDSSLDLAPGRFDRFP